MKFIEILIKNRFFQNFIIFMNNSLPISASVITKKEFNVSKLERKKSYSNAYDNSKISKTISNRDENLNDESYFEKEINPLSLSEARKKLSNCECKGYLNKMGFKWFKLWKRRYVVIKARTIVYYEVFIIIN